MNKIRCIVAGWREFADYPRAKGHIKNILNDLCERHNVTIRQHIEIISGKARGADYMGEVFSAEHGTKLKCMPAKWDKLGRGAGYARNADMANYATQEGYIPVLIAFDCQQTVGTKHMIDIAKSKNMNVFIITLEDDSVEEVLV